MTTTRIRPLEPPYSPPVAAALGQVMPSGVAPLLLFRSLAVNERVFLRMMAGSLLDRGAISLREREIVIDRTCARCGSAYEWGVHISFFRHRVGFTEEEVGATCAADPESTVFTPRERLLLRLVDALHDTGRVEDRLWYALRTEWTESQLIEIVALVGFYHLVLVLHECFRAAPGALRPAVPRRPRARARGNLNGGRPRELGRQLTVSDFSIPSGLTRREDRGISLLVAAIRSIMPSPQGLAMSPKGHSSRDLQARRCQSDVARRLEGSTGL
jgi:hypothetical protein